MTFDIAKLAITKASNGSLQVKETTVYWRGPQTFSTYNSPPTCPGVALPVGCPLSTGPCAAGPGSPPRYYSAKLTFNGNIDDWDPHYDACREITQEMDVGSGVGLKKLKIQLSCGVHPKPPLRYAARCVHAATAVLQVFHPLFRRLFGTPG